MKNPKKSFQDIVFVIVMLGTLVLSYWYPAGFSIFMIGIFVAAMTCKLDIAFDITVLIVFLLIVILTIADGIADGNGTPDPMGVAMFFTLFTSYVITKYARMEAE
jgi:hypothetical protein